MRCACGQWAYRRGAGGPRGAAAWRGGGSLQLGVVRRADRSGAAVEGDPTTRLVLGNRVCEDLVSWLLRLRAGPGRR
eukprot:5570611-Pyramimonas_sp.AAC.1